MLLAATNLPLKLHDYVAGDIVAWLLAAKLPSTCIMGFMVYSHSCRAKVTENLLYMGEKEVVAQNDVV